MKRLSFLLAFLFTLNGFTLSNHVINYQGKLLQSGSPVNGDAVSYTHLTLPTN